MESGTFSFTVSPERPGHYNQGEVECITAIRSSMTLDEYCGFLKGNVEKYVWRYKNKGGISDLQKASVYLTWLLEAEKQREARDEDA